MATERRRLSPGASGWVGAVLTCASVMGCDVPTDPPIVEQRWAVPLDVVTLEQEELLPQSGVTIVGDAYEVEVDDFVAVESLGVLCPLCAPLDGLTAPVPPFAGSYTASTGLPRDVVSIEVASGTVTVSIANGLGFDPLEGGGTLRVTISGGPAGPTLGGFTLAPPGDALPVGGVTVRTIAVAPGLVEGPIRADVEVESPGGQMATIHVDDEVGVSVVTEELRVSAVTAVVDGLSASLTEESLDTDDIGSDLVDDVQRGTVRLEVTNPFDLSFTGTLLIGPVTRTVSIGPEPTSTILIDYTGAELRSILDLPDAPFSGFGTVFGGPARITPAADVVIDPSVDIVIEVGR